MALTDNLNAFWELEEASGSRVDSVASISLTDHNTVTSNTGKVGTAGQFTAANTEYLSCASQAALQTGDIDFTLAAWVYMDTKSAFMTIASKYGTTAGTDREYLFVYDNTADRFRLSVFPAGVSGIVYADTLGSPSTATWYYVVAWHDSVNNQVGIAVNGGAADLAAYTSGTVAGTYDFEMGYSTQLGNPWNGRIDQFGFWKRVVGSTDRTSLYNGGSGLSYSAMTGGGGGSGTANLFFRRRR